MFDAPLFHCHFTCSEMAPPPARSLVSGCVAIFLNTRSSFHSLAFGGKRFIENAARSPQESSLLVCQQMDWERGKKTPRGCTRELLQRIWRKIFTKAGGREMGGKHSCLFGYPGCFRAECGPVVERPFRRHTTSPGPCPYCDLSPFYCSSFPDLCKKGPVVE